MIGKIFSKKYYLYNIIYILLLIIISFSINQFYSYRGVLPVDSFSTFNSGYDILNGSVPFRDFWTIKDPVLDFFQAFFFKIFGVSWFSYAAHSSTFNTLFALATFFVLKKFNLESKFSFFYSLLASILMYPTYGTPFTDHHVSIFSIFAIYSLCLAIKTKKNIYWFLIPIFLFLAFFTKQTPSGYFAILIIFISILYLIKNFDKRILISGIISTSLIILFFIFFFERLEIPFENFLIQYFLFPIHLGESRVEWLLPLDFQRFVLRYKLIYLALSVPIFLLIKNLFNKFSTILIDENLIYLLLFATLLIFISHQLMTINGMFIYFLIPIFSGFSHIYSTKLDNKKKLISVFLILSLISTLYYHEKYISKRDTLILRDIDLKQSIDAAVLSNKLKNLKWITHHYPKNPELEIEYLIDAMQKIKNDNRKKMIVTDYQFISVLLSINDNSAARIWWRHHIYPEPKKKYFSYWKKFLLGKIIRENIEVIYTIHPLEGEINIFDGLLDQACYESVKTSEILTIQKITVCEELKLFSI